MNNLNKNYWESRYQKEQTGWDIGEISTPLKNYFNSLKNKEISLLIPGCGRAYEAEYLHRIDFKNVYICDWAIEALMDFKERVPSFPNEHLINGDFFKIEHSFDLIVEQTFFCAIDPQLRPQYAQKVHELLNENGLFIGLFFNTHFENNPPYGGSKEEYINLFSPYFEIIEMDIANDSIKPRLGNELFFIMKKRDN